jgi:adenylate cyclase class 2
MNKTIIEIKARCTDLGAARERLVSSGARFHGSDHQIDTYFDVPAGRLKLREGTIENALILYNRDDQPEPKESRVLLYETGNGASLKQILLRLFSVFAVVDKQREIYYVGNVKIHLDVVAGLGTFLEIEAIDDDGSRTPEELRRQCVDCMALLRVGKGDLLVSSYSDMLCCVASLAPEVTP